MDAKSLVPTFSRATRPTLIESFFVVRQGEGLRSGILTVAGRVPEGLVRRATLPSRSTRLGWASLTSAHSSRLTTCVQPTCAALAVPTSCVVTFKTGAKHVLH